jgi:hypothetical protein
MPVNIYKVRAVLGQARILSTVERKFFSPLISHRNIPRPSRSQWLVPQHSGQLIVGALENTALGQSAARFGSGVSLATVPYWLRWHPCPGRPERETQIESLVNSSALRWHIFPRKLEFGRETQNYLFCQSQRRTLNLNQTLFNNGAPQDRRRVPA